MFDPELSQVFAPVLVTPLQEVSDTRQLDVDGFNAGEQPAAAEINLNLND